MSKPVQTPEAREERMVPFERVTGLVRQLTHDVRNGLNNVDLQAALLQELVTDQQVVPEVKRLRAMVTETARMLQDFSRMYWMPELHPVTYSAAALVEDFQMRLEKALPALAPHLQWAVKLQDETIAVDLELIFRCLVEFFKNALHFREGSAPIVVNVTAQDGRMVMELREPKSAVAGEPDSWGTEPLVSHRRGGFGMGLFYARQVLALHGGELGQVFDRGEGQLVTRIVLPLAPR